MGDKTKIQWTNASWPIVNGCRRVSPGCENCYAERLIATRLSQTPKYKGLAVMKGSGPRWTGEARLWKEHLDWPLKWTRPRKIFVADMGDLFYEAVSNEEIAAVFGVMAACPQHTFQCLTKRAKRMQQWFRWVEEKYGSDDRPWKISTCYQAAKSYALNIDEPRHGVSWPLPNVWLGVSVEDQQRADERIPLLLDTPSAVRFLSVEPQLEDVRLREHFMSATQPARCACGHGHGFTRCPNYGGVAQHCHHANCGCEGFVRAPGDGIHWVIVGGESGPGRRPYDISWARNIIRQCKETGVACFVKQLGSKPYESVSESTRGMGGIGLALKDRKGGDMEEWPEDLRVREWPEVRA